MNCDHQLDTARMIVCAELFVFKKTDLVCSAPNRWHLNTTSIDLIKALGVGEQFIYWNELDVISNPPPATLHVEIMSSSLVTN
jgi:hypothetical protein